MNDLRIRRYSPDVERHADNGPPGSGPATGIFDRLNNYLLLLYAGACLLMYYSLAGFLFLGGLTLLSLSLPGLMGIIFPLYILSSRFSLRFAGEYRLFAPGPALTLIALLVTAGLVLPVEALSTFMEKRWPPDADYISFLLAIKPKGALSFAAVAFGIAIATPVAEELLFRGFIQRIFVRNMPAGLAIALSSVIFAASHLDVPALPAAVLLGGAFGLLFHMTGNLIYPILGHALFNLVSLIRLDAISEADLQAPTFRYPPPVYVAASIALLVFALALLRRRAAR